MVEWVTEPCGKGQSWEERNKSYLKRIKQAPVEALNLSCADKTSNIREMCYWLRQEQGYKTEDFTSKDHATNLAKFEALDEVFRGKVVASVYDRFTQALDSFSRGL